MISRESAQSLEHQVHLQTVLDNAADGIMSVDSHGLIRSLNPAAARIFGCDARDVIGQHIRSLIPRPYLREHQTYRRPGGTETVLSLGREVTGLRQDGRAIPLELSVGQSSVPGQETLFVAIVRDVSQRKRTEAALTESHAQLRNLAARLQSIREEERTRISREVHDELGQALTGLKMDLAWLLSKLSSDPPGPRQRTKEALQLVDRTIQTVRKITSELRPAVLDNLGLAAAIEWQASEFQRRTGIACSCQLELDGHDLHPELATALFRIFQETLTNVARHAQASEVQVRLHQQGQESHLEVHDNGRGITEAERADVCSLGLLGMRERAQQFGGQLTIEGAPGQGTRAHLRMPLWVQPVQPQDPL